jgi:hypothetical protein
LPRSRLGRPVLDADPVVIRPSRGRKARGAGSIEESTGIVTLGKVIELERRLSPDGRRAEDIEVVGVT